LAALPDLLGIHYNIMFYKIFLTVDPRRRGDAQGMARGRDRHGGPRQHASGIVPRQPGGKAAGKRLAPAREIPTQILHKS
jgi:hypothetical protein